MPDITMCVSEECPLKSKCYRHEAKVSQDSMQSYANFYTKDEECKYYWEINQDQPEQR